MLSVALRCSQLTLPSAGLIYTLPALLILKDPYWTHIIYWETMAIALVAGILGVVFSIPLRRTFIVDQELPFPEGFVLFYFLLKLGFLFCLYQLLQAPLTLCKGVATGEILKLVSTGSKAKPE